MEKIGALHTQFGILYVDNYTEFLYIMMRTDVQTSASWGLIPKTRGWGTWIILLPNVFTIFPNCVPSFHVFPELFPIAPHFIPILKYFAQNSTLATNSIQSAVIHSYLVWFILISSWVCSQFFFFEGAILIGPSPMFFKHFALWNRSTSLDP